MLLTAPGGSPSDSSADLGPLELVDLRSDPRQGRGDHREQQAELGRPVAAARPGDIRLAEPQALAERSSQLESLRAEEAETAHRAGELTDEPARCSLPQALEVTPDLVGPGSRLEAECHQRAWLPVGPARHHRVPVAGRDGQELVLDRPQVTPGDGAVRFMASAIHVSVRSWTVAP